MSKIAFIFPGQGAQYVGMAKDFYEQFATSREVFEQASETLKLDMQALCFEENELLNQTEYTQAAMVTASVAVLREVEKRGITADVTAGLSLGEYCALVASRAIGFCDAVKVVRQRGILMQNTVPLGQGAMAAVLGMKAEQIEEVLDSIDGVQIANYNCPGQIVMTGVADKMEEATKKLKEAGARRVLPLKVSGPFHSDLMKPAGEKLANILEDVAVSRPHIPYVTNVTASYVTDEKEIKPLLQRQVASSVRWQQSMELMIENGVDTFIEMGPGKTLTGFMKKINRGVKAINIDKVEDLKKLDTL